MKRLSPFELLLFKSDLRTIATRPFIDEIAFYNAINTGKQKYIASILKENLQGVKLTDYVIDADGPFFFPNQKKIETIERESLILRTV